MRGYEVRVILNEFSPITSRDIVVPDYYTFEDLKNVINIIWGFTDNEKSLFILRPFNDVVADESLKNDYNVKYDIHTTQIKEIFNKSLEITYLYDLNERWLIGVKVNGKVKCDNDHAIVTDFEGKYNPIEKCGGVWELSEIIYFSKNPKKRDNSKNAKLVDKLKKFDIDEVNEKLKNFK